MNIGETKNKWTLLAESPDRKGYGIFRCKCGRVKEVNIYTVEKGKSKGCKKCQFPKMNKTEIPDDAYKKIRKAFHRAVYRCYNEKNDSYYRYGPRGIKVCDEWLNNPELFIRWAYENGWGDGLTLDRIDNDGDYCPENCRWVTPKEQARNRSDNIVFEHDGERKCMMEWCEIVGIPHYVACQRYRRGYRDFETVFFVGRLSGGGPDY